MDYLCNITIKQARCSEWFLIRNLGISASVRAHSIITQKTKSTESLLNGMFSTTKKCVDTPATRYGKKFENTAIRIYEKHFNVKLAKIGVLVSKSHPWLCASLDAVVMHGNKVTKILEIKCALQRYSYRRRKKKLMYHILYLIKKIIL